jgi:hypothetical protein
VIVALQAGVHQIEYVQLVGVDLPATIQTSVELPVLPAKRKREEVADSQSEDEGDLGSDGEFAWIEDDPVEVLEAAPRDDEPEN